MDHDQDSENEAGQSDKKQPGRSWTERLTGPIRYRRFTDLDAGGRPSIFFKFELAPGQRDLPQEVYDVLNEMKQLNPRFGHGIRPRPTGLEFNRSKKHGRVWRMPDNQVARTAADIIDGKLRVLAHQIDDREQGRKSQCR
jgi:hypothetical protein